MFIQVIAPVMCYIHFHTIAKDVYFIHSSYYSPKKMTENVLTIAVLRQNTRAAAF